MKIKLGDGFQASTRGKCKSVDLCVGEVTKEVEAYLFEL